uniref:NME/NM23 nucleoside diphosphate kinase 6 n=1 Tax=Canis lupus dingo TaxID=286419 RepID=A0A8C0L6P0_CANLU
QNESSKLRPIARRPPPPRRAAQERPPPSRLRAPKPARRGSSRPRRPVPSYSPGQALRRDKGHPQHRRWARRPSSLRPATPTAPSPPYLTHHASTSGRVRGFPARTPGRAARPNARKTPPGPRRLATAVPGGRAPRWRTRSSTRSEMTSILRSPQALQLTLALIKPDAVAHPLILEAVHQQILSNKFLIVRMKELLWRKEECQKFYQEHEADQSEPTSLPARMPSNSGGP